MLVAMVVQMASLLLVICSLVSECCGGLRIEIEVRKKDNFYTLELCNGVTKGHKNLLLVE